MKGGGGGSKRYERYTKPITLGNQSYNSAGGSLQANDCLTIKFETELIRIQPIFGSLNIGDGLSIELDAGNKLGAYYEGKLCGHIISPHNKNVIECIKKSFIFRGIIIDKKGKIKIDCIK